MISKKQRKHIEKLAKLNTGRKSKFKGKKRPEFSEEWKRNISKARTGKKFGRNKKPIIVKCKYCGDKREVNPAATNRGRNKFCSKSCYHKWLSEHRKKENHPNWQGGISFEPYPQKWTDDFKKGIRKRDNYTCQECGIHQDELDRKLDVHHIDYNKNNLDPENLISLCKSCHMETNYNRDYWKDYFLSIK